MDSDTNRRLIAEHRRAIRELEADTAELEAGDGSESSWPPSGFYLLWHLVTGSILGTLGASVSLLANTVGAPLLGRRPLELIRVYLTFPMGERALQVDSGVVLTAGCLLYLVTGALFGILLHLAFTVYWPQATLGKRLLIATGVGLLLWILNFYLVLSWLQPLLLDGNWIVRLVPPWVGALSHLAFAWTVAVGEGMWGGFTPYRRRSEA